MNIYDFVPVSRGIDIFAVGVDNWEWSHYVNEVCADNNICPWFLEEIADYLTIHPSRVRELAPEDTGVLVSIHGAVDDRGLPRPPHQSCKVFSRKAWADLRAALCGGHWKNYI